jgi:alpha-L-fucosidase 2
LTLLSGISPYNRTETPAAGSGIFLRRKFVDRFSALFIVLLSLSVCLAQGPVKIACVGNSITYGYGLADRSRSYPGVLQDLFGATDYTVRNFGVNSVTVSKNGNLPYWTRGMMDQVFSFQPDIVTVMLGTNDTKPENWEALGYGEQFKTDYEALIDTFLNMSSGPAVYPVLPVPVFSHPTGASWGIRDSVIRSMLPLIREAAEDKGLQVIDCNTPLLDFPQFFSVDGVHPDAAGEDTLAHVIYRALTATGTVKRSPKDLISDPYQNGIVGNVSSTGYNTGGNTGAEIELLDLQGRCIVSRKMDASCIPHVFPRNFRSGLYLLHISSSGRIRRYVYRK